MLVVASYGIKTPFFWPDIQTREVCCLSEAKIQDVTERLPQLVKSTVYYPLLLHVGTNDMRQHNQGKIKQDLAP